MEDRFKFLLVGDPHFEKDNLPESARLMTFIRQLCAEHDVRPIFMGDQYSNHGNARVEVQNFLLHEWDTSYGPNNVYTPMALVGNHDMNHECTANWMAAHDHQATVISDTRQIEGPLWALPYVKSNEKFIESVNLIHEQGGRIILCHQEFNGCELENGFFAPGGVDVNILPQDTLFISGHIHKQQALRYIEGLGHTILYVGAPRQRTRSDIGRINYVVLWSPSTGTFKNIQVPGSVCEPFMNIVITPETTGIGSIFNSPHVYVDIYGPKDFIKKMQKELPELVKCRTFPEKENVTVQVKESDGIPKAFTNYALSYADKNKLTASQLQSIVGRIYEKCPLLRGA